MADQANCGALDLAPLPTELNFDDEALGLGLPDKDSGPAATIAELAPPSVPGRQDDGEGASAGRTEPEKLESTRQDRTDSVGDGEATKFPMEKAGGRQLGDVSGKRGDLGSGSTSEASAASASPEIIGQGPASPETDTLIFQPDAVATTDKAPAAQSGEAIPSVARITDVLPPPSVDGARDLQDGVPAALTKEALASLSSDFTRPALGEKVSSSMKGNTRANGIARAEADSAFSSPLSSLPDLPTFLPASPTTAPSRPNVHPPQLFLSPELTFQRLDHSASDHAESSAQGAARAARARKQATASGSGSGKRKASAPADGGSKKKSSKTADGDAKRGRKGTGAGNGYSQDDAIDIDGDGDGEFVQDDGDDDGDYKPGRALSKAKKPIVRRGAKRKVLEYFGRTHRVLSDEEDEEDDVEAEPDGMPIMGRTSYKAPDQDVSSPYESPEPIEQPSRAISPPANRNGANSKAEQDPTADTGTAAEASNNASITETSRMTTRGGATLTPMKLPERKLGTKLKNYNEAQIRAMLRGKWIERQIGTCQRPRYAKWGKCTQCVAKVGGDSCRFRDFRVFPIDPMTADITGPGYFKPYKLSEDITPLPTEFNVPFTEERILRTEKTVAPILLPLITRELRHIVKNKAIKREVDAAKHRSVCDFCQSTIFAGYFFCRLCGKDYCLSCERFFSEDGETMDQSPWHIFAAARPRLMHCSARAGKTGDGKTLEPGPRTYGNADVEGGDRVPVDGHGQGEAHERASSLATGEKRSADGFLTSPSFPLEPSVGDHHTRGVKRKADGLAPDQSPRTDEAASDAHARASNRAGATAAGQANGIRLATRTRQIKWHFRPDLQPVSRFDEEEIKRHWLDLAGYSIRGEEADWKALFGLGELDAGTKSKGLPPVEGHRMVDADVLGSDAATGDQSDNGGAKAQQGKADGMDVEQVKEESEPDVKQLIDGIESLRRHLAELASRTERKAEDARKPAVKSTLLAEASDASISTQDASDQAANVDFASFYTQATHPTAPLPPDPASLHAESHPFMRIHVDKLDNSTFDALWGKGEPMVVDGIDHRLKEKWDPDGMIDMFGDERCGVTNCETNVAWESTVREFFEAFKDKEGRGRAILKLKDWPATEDFKQTHPRLYNDFSDALPVPDYTRREGAMNLYAHFPPGSSRPDIGPKMYNAFAARERKGGQGSTRLHMDVADAINVMLYASPLDILPEKGKKVEVKREVVDLTGDGQDGEVAVERKEGGGDGEVAKNKVVQVEVPNGSGLSGEAEKARSEDSSDLLSSQSAALGAQADPQPPRLPEEPVPIVGSESHNQDSAARDGIPGGDNAKSLGFQGSREATPLRSIAEDKVSDSPDTTKSKDPRQPGCAVWDIFRAQDADKIRTYLSRKFGSRHVFVDPIHAQMFFLDASMRRELWEKYGVVSHRIYQYPGQAVFIPAGCAHQVCNLADCIKIALDFVSPQNVRRCQQLTHDFRNENFVKAWKEDVLQLYNILWFAWTSARETRCRREKEKADQVSQDAQHLADVAVAQRKARNNSQVVTSSARDEPAPRDEGPPTPKISDCSMPEQEGKDAGAEKSDRETGASDDAESDTAKVQEEQDRLVARLLSAALAAPDAPPPPDARAPSAATGARWAEAKAAASASAVPIIQRNARASGAATANATAKGHSSSAKTAVVSTSRRGPGARERMAARSASAQDAQAGASGGIGERISDLIKDGNLSMEAAFDSLRRDMGGFAGVQDNGAVPAVSSPRAVDSNELNADVDEDGQDAPLSLHSSDVPPLPDHFDIDDTLPDGESKTGESTAGPPSTQVDMAVDTQQSSEVPLPGLNGTSTSDGTGTHGSAEMAAQLGEGASKDADVEAIKSDDDIVMAE